jgi:hypothetical protein
MKRYILFLLAAVALAIPATAAAWHPVVGGSAACDESRGVFAITWTVGNSQAGEIMHYTGSRAAVASGDIAAGGSRSFSESVPGTSTGTLTLNVSGSWDNHEQGIAGSATVGLGGNCTAPTPPGPPRVCADGGPPNSGKDGMPGNDDCDRGKTITPTTTTVATNTTTTTTTPTITTQTASSTTATPSSTHPAALGSSGKPSVKPSRGDRSGSALGKSVGNHSEQLAFTP